MAKYTIVYRGWTTAEVAANSIEEAEEQFYDEGLNELNDSEIDDIQLTDAIKVDPAYSQYYLG